MACVRVAGVARAPSHADSRADASRGQLAPQPAARRSNAPLRNPSHALHTGGAEAHRRRAALARAGAAAGRGALSCPAAAQGASLPLESHPHTRPPHAPPRRPSACCARSASCAGSATPTSSACATSLSAPPPPGSAAWLGASSSTSASMSTSVCAAALTSALLLLPVLSSSRGRLHMPSTGLLAAVLCASRHAPRFLTLPCFCPAPYQRSALCCAPPSHPTQPWSTLTAETCSTCGGS
jgi:hypothetical protein